MEISISEARKLLVGVGCKVRFSGQTGLIDDPLPSLQANFQGQGWRHVASIVEQEVNYDKVIVWIEQNCRNPIS